MHERQIFVPLFRMLAISPELIPHRKRTRQRIRSQREIFNMTAPWNDLWEIIICLFHKLAM